MKRFAMMLMTGVLAVVLSACAQGGGEQTQPDQNAGQPTQQPDQNQGQTGETAPSGEFDAAAAEKVYKQNCAACHGQNLEGAMGPNLTKVGSKLSQDEILDILKNGRNSMPGNLVSGDEAENIAAWLAAKK